MALVCATVTLPALQAQQSFRVLAAQTVCSCSIRMYVCLRACLPPSALPHRFPCHSATFHPYPYPMSQCLLIIPDSHECYQAPAPVAAPCLHLLDATVRKVLLGWDGHDSGVRPSAVSCERAQMLCMRYRHHRYPPPPPPAPTTPPCYWGGRCVEKK